MKIAGYDEVNKGECFESLFQVITYTEIEQEIPYFGESKNFKKSYDLKSILEKYSIKYLANEISVTQINNATNLNDLLLKELIKMLKVVKPYVAYIDSFMANTETLKKVLLAECPDITFFVRTKYDRENTLVGLASVIANNIKYERFQEYRNKGINFGSGNLADPITINYIKRHWPNIPFLRKNWNLKSIFKR